MSLIIDALKKAQQLRLKESKGVPFFDNPKPVKKNFKNKKLFMISGATFLLIIISFSSLLIFPKSNSKSIPQETIIVDKNQPYPVIENQKVEINPVLESKAEFIESPKEEKNIKPKFEKKKMEIPISMPKTEGLDSIAILKSEKTEVEKEDLSSHKVKREEKEYPKVEIKDESRKDLSIKKDIITQFNLAVSLQNQKNLSKAIKAYEQVIEMDPCFYEAYNNLGLIYLEMGDYDNSLKNFRKAIEINPNYEKALNNLGIIYYFKGDYEKAMEEFQKAIEINPNNIEGHIHLGIIYKKKGQLEKGIESYKKALSIQSQNGEAHYNLGILYENTGNKDMAIYHYQKFIEIAEKDYPELVRKVSDHIRNLIRRN